MPPWVALAIYAAGFVIAARVAFSRSDDGDRFDSVVTGLLWPIVLAVLATCMLLALPTLGAKTKRDRRVRAAAVEQERRRLAARTAELEAENDRLRKAAGEP